MTDYWTECVSEAFDDAGLTATDDQIDTVASWVEGAHENYSTAMGYDVASRNYHAEQKSKFEKLEKELQREQNKRGCTHCGGHGYFVENYGTRSGQVECHHCGGTGKD